MQQAVSGVTYQVTDLARNHRKVVDAARHGGALIRDKDGLTLLLAPAESAQRSSQLASMASDLLRLERAVGHGSEADVVSCGQFSWLSVLPRESQADFIEEVFGPMLVALSGGPLGPLVELIEDWQATAEVWADEDLRSELLAPVDAPLVDATL